MGDKSTAFEKQYEAGFQRLSQQMTSRLKNLVTVKEFNKGEDWYMNQIGAVDAAEITGVEQNTVYSSTPISRREMKKKRYGYAELFEDWENTNMSADPEDPFTQNALSAFGREFDDAIVTALGGTAQTGAEGGTATVLPAGQIIGGAAAAFDYDLLLDAVEKYDEADVPASRLSLIIGAPQKKALWKLEKFINNDYGATLQIGALTNTGMVNGYLGTIGLGRPVDIYMTNRLIKTGNLRRCYLFSKTGVGFGVGKMPFVQKLATPNKWGETSVIIKSYFGATRLDEDQVVGIDIDETV